MRWSNALLIGCATFAVAVAAVCAIEGYLRARRWGKLPAPWMRDCKRNGAEAPGRYQ